MTDLVTFLSKTLKDLWITKLKSFDIQILLCSISFCDQSFQNLSQEHANDENAYKKENHRFFAVEMCLKISHKQQEKVILL
jgi:hypothetical protein